MTKLRPLWIAVPVLNVAQQVLLKLSAESAGASQEHWLFPALYSHWFVGAVLAQIICFAIWIKMLSDVEASRAFPLFAASYILTMAAAFAILDEPLTLLGLAGSILILIGLWCVATSPVPGERWPSIGTSEAYAERLSEQDAP